jgi:cytochrome c
MFKSIYFKCLYFFLFTVSVFFACKATVNHTRIEPISSSATKSARILVFTKTKGWYHSSIPSGILALQKLGKENRIIVDTTKNANYFVKDSLKNYSAVIFLNTTGNVLNADQQVAFEQYIQAGGGFVGIHSAADTEYDWPWYNRLVGAYFASHPNNPNVRPATVDVLDSLHLSSNMLPNKWKRTDEWYNYKNIQTDLKIVANLDEDSYEGGLNGENHPIAWYHEYDGGRAFYTGGGHTDESYAEPLFLKHLLGGIKYAINENQPHDYSKAYSVKQPEENRFVKTILSSDLNEPMQLAVASDGRVFFIERKGSFYVYNPSDSKTSLSHKFEIFRLDQRNGLQGITLDPDFDTNNFIYFFYTAQNGKSGKAKQNISRFIIGKDNKLDIKSEKVIIDIPIEFERSAHTGGSLAWDKNKNLYISTGDNTNPFGSDGYAPLDRRAGKETFDAERSSANTNDLRGKILRIHPNADGSYSIPEGNLFAPGTPKTRPEIYIMGCRNPYRISVDAETGTVYWGDIGPDAGTDGKQGPRGFDEFNQAKQAGNFGWPHFIADNKAYNEYDFDTKISGNRFDNNGSRNKSHRNSGLELLPPPQKAMIWYPYEASEEFPMLGIGGRCAMGGPFYRFDANLKSPGKVPEYYNNTLFVYDWMRNWVFALRFDENQNYKRMEPFLPNTGDFRRPVDMEIGPDGSIYMLEYGSVYGVDNYDARLVRLDFNAGNRAPLPKISTTDTIGRLPLHVSLKSKSFDYDDEDILSYEWRIDGHKINAPATEYTFHKNGVYKVFLKVTDNNSLSGFDSVEIKVGNTLPKVAIATGNNRTFFFPEKNDLKYKVKVEDFEDKIVDAKRIIVKLNYISKVENNKSIPGHQTINSDYNLGNALIAGSDCKACHQMNAKSVGPSFTAVSKRYKGNNSAINKLADKIIIGGGGAWGEIPMSAHPQIPKTDAVEIVKYILSITDKKTDLRLPPTGTALLKDHQKTPDQGRYFLTASYTDKGGYISPLTTTKTLVLRPAKVEAEDADDLFSIVRGLQTLSKINHKSYFVLKDIDLKDIKRITYRYAAELHTAKIEVRAGSPKGKLLSTFHFNATKNNDYVEGSSPILNPGGSNDLFFVFIKPEKPYYNLMRLDWLKFEL